MCDPKTAETDPTNLRTTRSRGRHHISFVDLKEETIVDKIVTRPTCVAKLVQDLLKLHSKDNCARLKGEEKCFKFQKVHRFDV